MKSFFSLVCLALLGLPTAHAGSATWLAAPASGDWNTSTNWSPGTVPNSAADTATFHTSTTPAISLSGNAEIGSIFFNAGASAFTITAAPTFTLTISGSGITNNSATQQNFVSAINGVGQWGTIWFTNNAIAGSLTKFTNKGTAPDRLFPGITEFFNNSNAGSATFINEKTQASLSGGTGGYTQFWDNSSAANANITNVGGSANGESGGFTYFNENSTAGNATFTTNGAAAGGASGGQVRFLGNSTGGNATFTSNGSSAAFTNPGITMFTDNSSAGNALLIANGGSNGGLGGLIYIFGDATGSTARVQLNGNGSLDVSSHSPDVTVAQLEGSGNVYLGLTNLILGGNNISTTYSGVFQSEPGVSGGSLTKVGTGTLTLMNANTHSGVTTLSAGSLKLTNSLALQSSTVSLSVSGLIFDSSVVPHAFTFGGLAGTADLGLQDNAASPHAVALTVGTNNNDGSYSGKLTGTGSLTKIGMGTITLAGLNTFSGKTTVNGGLLIINGSLGNSASVTINSGGALSGTGIINGPLTVNSGGMIDLTGGTLTVNNQITNNGLFIISNGSKLAGVISFINNGTLDIMTAGTFTFPNGFVNHGIIIDSRAVKTKSIIRYGDGFTAVIASYTGHIYQLQKALSPNGGSFVNVDGTPAQRGTTGEDIVLTDLYATEPTAFYRILVNP
jgi:autotransporter-associated beta strand protein